MVLGGEDVARRPGDLSSEVSKSLDKDSAESYKVIGRLEKGAEPIGGGMKLTSGWSCRVENQMRHIESVSSSCRNEGDSRQSSRYAHVQTTSDPGSLERLLGSVLPTAIDRIRCQRDGVVPRSISPSLGWPKDRASRARQCQSPCGRKRRARYRRPCKKRAF